MQIIILALPALQGSYVRWGDVYVFENPLHIKIYHQMYVVTIRQFSLERADSKWRAN